MTTPGKFSSNTNRLGKENGIKRDMCASVVAGSLTLTLLCCGAGRTPRARGPQCSRSASPASARSALQAGRSRARIPSACPPALPLARPPASAEPDASDSPHTFISVHTCTNVPSHLQALKLSSWHGSSSVSEDHRGSSPAGDIVDLGQPDSLPSALPPARPDLRPFTMGGCFSKPKPVELKIEVVLPEKERGKEELSASGKGSPRAYQGNGTARHFHAEERLPTTQPYPSPQDCVEATVCHVKDLENGQMREVELGWGKVLLVKDNGEFHALGHKCPHYGAPLVKGVLSRGRVRCPWHGACFNISTGDLEDFPGLDSLHKFQVKIEKEKVTVRASKQALQLQRRTKVMAKCISPSAGHSSSTNVLIVGAGAAGLVCAETLRQEGFSDRIVLCTLDRHLPYDRAKLSKSLDAQPEQLALRPKEFFRAYGIEMLTEAQVVTVDVRNKKAVFKDGFKLEYSKLLLAPGSSPKTLNCKGKDVENVFTIRTPEDANRVVRLARGRNAVVVGAGFLGMEVAAYLTEKAHSVSVVELEETPFRRFLGERVGRALMKMFENNRVKFYMQTEVLELRAQEGKLQEVVLKSSKVLRADVCVVGIGAVPATGFLRQSGIGLDSRGFIPVNKMMQTNVPGVFAAGDAVTFPLAWRNNRKVNIPHWQMAHAQGRVAAQNMLAQEAEINTVPYLWTAMFGKSLRYAGYGEGFDDVIIQGDLEELKFVAFYTKGDEVIAVASMNYDPIVSKVAEVLASGRAIRKREVDPVDLVSMAPGQALAADVITRAEGKQNRRHVLAHRERILSSAAMDLGRPPGHQERLLLPLEDGPSKASAVIDSWF
ncbi:Apoptosis-inducing factor 3 [Microtus ochrogaster]|uniref:Apoptosis-inducing factor 3 n=1 Tax=Microtus ochrogaster TaxID=79684 RepID=A0A8J6KQA1_MICOH|nr:Apoptosis-inducing factor 3 [Microtus ochrogaster]